MIIDILPPHSSKSWWYFAPFWYGGIWETRKVEFQRKRKKVEFQIVMANQFQFCLPQNCDGQSQPSKLQEASSMDKNMKLALIGRSITVQIVSIQWSIDDVFPFIFFSSLAKWAGNQERAHTQAGTSGKKWHTKGLSPGQPGKNCRHLPARYVVDLWC